MAYDNPNRIKYTHYFDFGAAADLNVSIRGPKGKAGRLWDYGVEGTTEIFAADTITPKISVGTTSDADAYGDELVLTGLASQHATSIRMLYAEQDSGFSTYMLDREIPKDTEVYMGLIGATGNPTGIGTAFVIIDWQD